MLNSSRGLIGSRVFPFTFTFFCIDWQPGGTGKQNISHQASAPVEKRPFFQSSYIWVMCLEVRREKKSPAPRVSKVARPTSSLPSSTDLRKYGGKNVMFCFDIDANSRAAFPGGENYCECLHAVPLRAEANTTNLASAGSGSDFLLYGGQKAARKKLGKEEKDPSLLGAETL